MELLTQFGSRVRELRKARGLTQEALALRVEVSERTIRNIESGTNGPALVTIGKLAAALGVEVRGLFEGAEGSKGG